MKDQLIVFVRIGLYLLVGMAARGGWLPDDVAELVKSPAAVEAITTALLGADVAVWYWFSKSRSVLAASK